MVTWLGQALPVIVAALDSAATAAARGYAAWLRHGCGQDDHTPSMRPSLRAHWRRAYLRAYGTALAGRITGGWAPAGTAGPVTADRLYRGHSARLAAERDANSADLEIFRPSTGSGRPSSHMGT